MIYMEHYLTNIRSKRNIVEIYKTLLDQWRWRGTKPAHNSGHLLDYIITRKDSSGVSNLYVADFFCDHRALHVSLKTLCEVNAKKNRELALPR